MLVTQTNLQRRPKFVAVDASLSDLAVIDHCLDKREGDGHDATSQERYYTVRRRKEVAHSRVRPDVHGGNVTSDAVVVTPMPNHFVMSMFDTDWTDRCDGDASRLQLMVHKGLLKLPKGGVFVRQDTTAGGLATATYVHVVGGADTGYRSPLMTFSIQYPPLDCSSDLRLRY